MKIDSTYFERCIRTLEKAHALYLKANPDNIDHELYRSACIKEFEIILEQSGKLLRKALKPYYPSTKEADKLFFKDVFRQAVLRSLISPEACERWLDYRDRRNHSAHDYGSNFAEEILQLIPQFIEDADAMQSMISKLPDDTAN